MKKSFPRFTPTLSYRFFIRSIAIILCCSIAIVTIDRVNADINPIVRFTPPPPPAGDPPTGRLRGGASRNGCPKVTTELTALATTINNPKDKTDRDNLNNNRVWGLTTFDRPTLLFYIPYVRENIFKAEFVLQDDREDDVYRSDIPLANKVGILGITLPETVTPLAIDRNYTWYFKIYCQADDRLPIYVKGVIQRIALPNSIDRKISEKTLQERLEIYATNGIWYDTITLLAKIRLANPNAPKSIENWINLLESNGLGEIKNAILLE